MPLIVDVDAGAVLFDFDGVLADSTGVVEQVWRNFAARHDLDAPALLADLHGRRMADILRSALPHLPPYALDEEAALVEAAEVELVASVRAQPGAHELLASLADVPWAIVTSGTRPVAFGRIEALGFPRPSVLVTAEDVDAGKPSPEPYLHAATKLGISAARCIVVEDAPAGITAGCAAGATTVAVATSHRIHQLTHADHLVRDTAAIERVAGAPLKLRLHQIDR